MKGQKNRSVLYVTRDRERALGLPPHTPGYFIATNTPPGRLDTHELLARPKTAALIKKTGAAILVFKNTNHIERICAGHGWHLLNPPAALAALVEEKLSQLTWLGPLKRLLPPHRVITAKELRFNGKKFIVQFNRAHTGQGTVLISSARQAAELAKKFPDRPVRVTRYIQGTVFTNNTVVWGKKILPGNISLQITGLKPFTDQPFATVGNDWAAASKLLTKKQLANFIKIVRAVGQRLVASGWRGLFGVDVVRDDATGRLYLLEVNARQPASATYESQLQRLATGAKRAKNYMTTFEAHLAALCGKPYRGQKLIPLTNGANGAQLVARVPRQAATHSAQRKIAAALAKQGFTVLSYNNVSPGQDWLRIQAAHGMMADARALNARGRPVAAALKKFL